MLHSSFQNRDTRTTLYFPFWFHLVESITSWIFLSYDTIFCSIKSLKDGTRRYMRTARENLQLRVKWLLSNAISITMASTTESSHYYKYGARGQTLDTNRITNCGIKNYIWSLIYHRFVMYFEFENTSHSRWSKWWPIYI